jgi:hypothetical protein
MSGPVSGRRREATRTPAARSGGLAAVARGLVGLEARCSAGQEGPWRAPVAGPHLRISAGRTAPRRLDDERIAGAPSAIPGSTAREGTESRQDRAARTTTARADRSPDSGARSDRQDAEDGQGRRRRRRGSLRGRRKEDDRRRQQDGMEDDPRRAAQVSLAPVGPGVAGEEGRLEEHEAGRPDRRTAAEPGEDRPAQDRP